MQWACEGKKSHAISRASRDSPPKAVGDEGLAPKSPPRRYLRSQVPRPGKMHLPSSRPSIRSRPARTLRLAASQTSPAGRTARTQVFSPPVLQPDGSWGKPRSGLKGYSSVGRVAVSKTAGRGFESLCPCQARQIRRTRLFRSVTAGKPAPSRYCQALVAWRRRLPDLPALLSGHQRGRDRRPAGDHPEASLCRRPRRGRHLDLTLLQIPDERFRL
jgi:hypothetical protein